MPNNLDHIESEEIFEVVGNPPKWIFRYGISVIGMFFLILSLLSSVIKYPDEIESQVILTTEIPPIRLFAKTSGTVEKLFVSENQIIESGEIICIIQSSAQFEDVMEIEKMINKAQDSHEPYTLTTKKLSIGILQSAFSFLREASDEYIFFKKFNGHQIKISSINRQISSLNNLKASLDRQQGILEQQLEISLADLNRNEELLKSQSISNLDFEKVNSSYLNQKWRLESINSEIISNKVNLEILYSDLNETTKVYNSERRKIKLLYEEALNKMDAEIKSWNELYIISSPVSGKVSLGKIKAEKQFVNLNDEVATIAPSERTGKILGRTYITGKGIGKVKIGMKVIIQLDAYPYQEFGSITGTVESIASVPHQDGYAVEIAVSQKLITTYGKQLNFIQELSGSAKIIIENRSFGSRVFDRILSIVKNKA